MHKAWSVTLMLMITAGIFAAAWFVANWYEVGLLAALLPVAALVAFFWWCVRLKRPEGELPCSSVSCCHYLADQEKEPRQQS